MIWLAGHLPASGHEAEPAPGPTGADPDRDEEGSTRPAGPAVPVPGGMRQLLYTAAASPGGSADADALLVPTAPMLRHPLAIQRALRPLKRRIPSRLHQVLDEAATAAQIADRPPGHPWTPVMVPARERWLSLALVIDTAPAMGIWHPLAHELREAMFRLGAFRDVRVWLLADVADKVGIQASPRSLVMEP